MSFFSNFTTERFIHASMKFEKNDIQGAEQDQWHAKQIMAFVSEDQANVDSLFAHYSKMDYNKIINFESEFVDGNRQKTLIQFSDIDIRPRGSLIVNITEGDNYYIDATLSQISQTNNLKGKMAFVVNDLFDENHVSYINDVIIENVDNQNLKDFLNGIYNFEIFNYQRGEKIFMSLLDDPVLGVYAGINLSVLQNAKAELLANDKNYDNSIYITQKKTPDSFSQTQEKPDYEQSLTTITNVLNKNKRNPYVWYNLGNIHLQMQEFEKAIEDYTKAIQYEKNLAEAYYNRALTLLYLNNKTQAIKDLSKAGELGIQEAYVVMKRFN